MKAVDQYDLEGNYIATFESIGSASRKVNISTSAIKRAKDIEGFTGGGFIWKTLNNGDIVMV